MVLNIYATVDATKQGTFKGEGRGQQTNKIPGVAFAYGVVMPHDSTGIPSGKRQHQPIVFTKEWGASSPQFYQAAYTNETLKSVLFEFFTVTADGKEEVDHTFKLTNASIGKVAESVQSGATGGPVVDPRQLQEISIYFQKIEIVSLSGKTQTSDDWAIAV
jgi:type VI secretion system secreted protein Hcp